MKLYTEEQVRQAYNTGYHDSTINHVNDCHNFIDALNYLSKYIELPSDEDIDNEVDNYSIHLFDRINFDNGIRWILKQIKQQVDGK